MTSPIGTSNTRRAAKQTNNALAMTSIESVTATSQKSTTPYNKNNNKNKKKRVKQQRNNDAAKANKESLSTFQSIFHHEDSEKKLLPKLIVFDLDNTLWTPELYQIRQRQIPQIPNQIDLFVGVKDILQDVLFHHYDEWKASGIQFAIASRTNKGHWANELLNQFTIANDNKTFKLMDLFTLFDQTNNNNKKRNSGKSSSLVQIEMGSKKQHFTNLQKATGISYHDMIFFDDDIHLNLREVSQQLGVFSCHCPNGLIDGNLFTASLQRFHEKRLEQSNNDLWMGEIVTSVSLGLEEATELDEGRITTGIVEFYNPTKRFGFVKELQGNNKKKNKNKDNKSYFFHESKVAQGIVIQKGLKVEFETMLGKQNKPSACITKAFENNNNNGSQQQHSTSSSTSNDKDLISMPCFSMSQPFCSLLLNGIKTMESRNNDMLARLKPGTTVLLHCGRKDWHDVESFQGILLKDTEWTSQSIQRAIALPRSMRRGDICGLVTVGKTIMVSDDDKECTTLQRKVLAPPSGIGRYCTEITNVQWFSRGIRQRGQPGVYNVSVPSNMIPKQKEEEEKV